MKKIFAILLAAALLLSCGAFAAAGDATLMMDTFDDYFQGNTVCGDAVYMLGDKGVYSWRPGEEELTTMSLTLESEPDTLVELRSIFSDGETLYGMLATYSREDNMRELELLEVVELIPEGNSLALGEFVEVDTYDLTTDYGNGEQLVPIDYVACNGDWACMSVYDYDGHSGVYCMNITDGSGYYVDGENLNAVVPYKDGAFLVLSYDNNSKERCFYAFDPEDESLSELCDPRSGDLGYNGLAYSEESDRLFYMDSGYIYAVEGLDFDNAAPVAEFSTQFGFSNSAALLPGDRYVQVGWDNISVRSTNPDDMTEIQLRVEDRSYSDAVMNAYYSFGEKRSDATVAIAHDYTLDSKIIEAMMNRDSTVDIFVLDTVSQAYDALFERGYLLGLSENEEIRSAVEAMYPGFQKMLMRDGEIVAVPVQIYGWGIGVNNDAMEALGLTVDDLPGSWPELLDWLPELVEQLPEDGSVCVFDGYMTEYDARYTLFNFIMESYRLWLNEVGLERGYDTPELRNALEKLMQLDFSIFGLADPADLEDEDYFSAYYGSNKKVLFNTGVGTTTGGIGTTSTPILLSISPDYEPMLALDMSVAFVNPFTEHPGVAIEFLAEIIANMETMTAYNVSDALNEPIRTSNYEQYMQEIRDQIAQIEAMLPTLDPVDLPMYEAALAEMKDSLENDQDYWWDIAPAGIEWYRANARYISVKRYDYLNSSGDSYDIANQLCNGAIDVNTYISTINRKATMMAMEGN